MDPRKTKMNSKNSQQKIVIYAINNVHMIQMLKNPINKQPLAYTEINETIKSLGSERIDR